MFPFPLPGQVLTKICGLTRLEDALACAEAGADAIGINFFPESKRFHPLEQAAVWLEQAPRSLTRVAVLVNTPADEVRRLAGSGLIDVLQFHGDENWDDLAEFRLLGLPMIKALPLRPDTTPDSLRGWPADALLLDAYVPGTYGGTGHTVDWSHAAEVIAALAPLPVILSGGLTPDNIAEAVRRTLPAGVDVASGVEISPGLKDHGKIRNLVAQARMASPLSGGL
ncbi:MAG: phosphoribosylanthranilate isomerase [Verrucomicrobiota bacterium]